jgi:hypothetical protein
VMCVELVRGDSLCVLTVGVQCAMQWEKGRMQV